MLSVETYPSSSLGLILDYWPPFVILQHTLRNIHQEMTYVNERSVIATAVIFIILGILAVALRFKARRDKNLELGLDD